MEKEEEKKEEVNSTVQLSKEIDRMEQENTRREELLKREEELMARKLLGGVTEHHPEEQKPKEVTPGEYVKQVMGGKYGKG